MTKEARFAVVVRFDGEDAFEGTRNNPPLVYWHRTANAAARRLTALINRRASWVPKNVRCGTRFYVVDHADNANQYPLNAFKKQHGIK